MNNTIIAGTILAVGGLGAFWFFGSYGGVDLGPNIPFVIGVSILVAWVTWLVVAVSRQPSAREAAAVAAQQQQ